MSNTDSQLISQGASKEDSRYARQVCLAEIGQSGQNKLQAAHLLIIGAGGLAAPALPILAGAGIGRLTIIDPDHVTQSNLHRQTLFTEADCGKPKATLAATACQARNPYCNAQGHILRLTPENAMAWIETADLVLDCADSYAVSYTLSDLCHQAQKPLVSGSVLGMRGYVGGFCHQAPSLRAVFPQAPDNAANCANAGVLGSAVAMIGALQAQMALAVILELSPSPLGQMVEWDAQRLRSQSFRFDHAPEPTQRFPFLALNQLTQQDSLFELRSTDEAPTPIHQAARRLENIEALCPILDATEHTKRLVFACQTGLRAWRMAEKIAPHWQGEIALMAAMNAS